MDFESYVRSSGPRLLRLAWLLTGDAAVAEDLLQTAYARVLPRWKTVGEYDDPDAYVRRVMVNARSHHWRRAKREIPVATLPDGGHSDVFHVIDDVDRLVRALANLGVRQRTVLVLRYYADLSEADVAETLGISVGTVKSQAARGLAHVRAVLQPGSTAPSTAERRSS